MDVETTGKKNLKQKVAHEFEEMAILTAYLAFFFCALATYSLVLLNRFHISYFTYGAALLNALVIAKVILIGEAMRAGTKFERKPILFGKPYFRLARVRIPSLGGDRQGQDPRGNRRRCISRHPDRGLARSHRPRFHHLYSAFHLP
jgi:hypothetical protein